MLSRIAESIYWMNRQVERAENLARFIDATSHLMLDMPVGRRDRWEPLLHTTGDEEAFFQNYSEATAENVVQFLAFDSRYASSIVSCLGMARENARCVQHAIPIELWETINEFFFQVRAAAADTTVLDEPIEFFQHVKQAGHLFLGVMDSTMSHGELWHFGRVGRMLERADKTTRMLNVMQALLAPSQAGVRLSDDELQWSALLRAVGGLQMYRQRHQTISAEKVMEFLVLDKEFPRAIRFSAQAAVESLHELYGDDLPRQFSPAVTLLDHLSESDFDGVESRWEEFLDRTLSLLDTVGDAIQQHGSNACSDDDAPHGMPGESDEVPIPEPRQHDALSRLPVLNVNAV